MDFEKLEETLDEIVWNMMQTLNNKGVEIYDAMMIMDAIAHIGRSGQFEHFYMEFEYEKDDPGFKEWVKDSINL